MENLNRPIASEYRSLVEIFPDLVERLSFPMVAQAQSWLQTLAGKTVDAQLRERRIMEVRSAFSHISGYINLDEHGDFRVSLNIMNEDDPHEIALTLGHELAHTFSYDLNTTPPTGLLPPEVQDRFDSRNREQDSLYQRIECFCDAFGLKWLEIGNNRAIVLDCLELEWGITQKTRSKTFITLSEIKADS